MQMGEKERSKRARNAWATSLLEKKNAGLTQHLVRI